MINIILLTLLLVSVLKISAQTDTIKIPILVDPIVKNGHYIFTTKGNMIDGRDVEIKIFFIIDIPKDTVVIKPGFKKY